MNRKRLQQVILGSAGAVVLAGVALLAAAEYQAGHQFAPTESDRALNVNQVVFPEQEKQSETSDRSQDDNSEMLEKVRNADENEHPRENGNADYLFESRQTLSSNANQTAAVAGDTPNSATAGAGAAGADTASRPATPRATTSRPMPRPPGTVTLTGKDAHAWAEVYFDGVGWLPLDTTPSHYFEAVVLALLVAAAELWRAVRIRRVEHAYRRADPMRRAGMIEHQLFALLQAEEIDSTLGYETKAVDARVAEKFEKVKPGEFARTCALLERCVYGGQAPDAREERALSSFLWKLIRSRPKHTLLQNLKRRYRRI